MLMYTFTQVLSLTVPVHVGFETLSKTACTALVPMRLVNGAAPFHRALGLANVLAIVVDAPLEES